MADPLATAQRPVVFLLGATGRLAPAVAGALTHHGFDVCQVARRTAPGIDIAGVDTRHTSWWRPEPWLAFVEGRNVAAVINLVAGRDRRPEPAASAGVGAIRTMAAIRDAARARGSRPSTVHVGSVAEARVGTCSAYATAKRTARAEALRTGVSAIVTLAVVPRAAGSTQDRLLRVASSLAPRLAAVPIAVSPARAVGEALAGLVASLQRRTSDHPGTTQLVLAAQLRPVGDVVGAAPRHTWYGDLVATGAGRLRVTGLSRLDRLAALARLSRRPEPAAPHYLAGIPDDDMVPVEDTIDGLRLYHRQRADSLGDRWLLPQAMDREVADDG